MDERISEILIEAAHRAYVQRRREVGFHSFAECPVRKAEDPNDEACCPFCHPIIKPFENLTVKEKGLYKRDLEALFENLSEMGFSIGLKSKQGETWVQIC